jgi:putative transposase
VAAKELVALADGALGFWKALREVFPDTPRAAVLVPRQLECSCRPAEVGAPRCQSRARGDLQRRGPRTCLQAVAKITEHWVHLRTTNPIESTFATVRLRQRITKGPGSRAAGVAMAFKLIESTQARWRAVNAPKLVERPDESGDDQKVA